MNNIKEKQSRNILEEKKTKEIVNKYGVTKSFIYDWIAKYNKECENTTQNTASHPSLKEMRKFNLRIKELEKENSFLKKAEEFFVKESRQRYTGSLILINRITHSDGFVINLIFQQMIITIT